MPGSRLGDSPSPFSLPPAVVFFFCVLSPTQPAGGGRHGGNSRLLIYLLYYKHEHTARQTHQTKTQQWPEGAVVLRAIP